MTDDLKKLAEAVKAGVRKMDRRQIAAREKLKQTKLCAGCFTLIQRKPHHSEKTWARQSYCSQRCGGKTFGENVIKTPQEVMEWMVGLSSVDAETGCRNLSIRPDASGYPVFGWGGKKRKAHRVAYELSRGPIPEGMFVCHRCDNRRCIEPTHLFIGTNADNTADRNSKGRQAKGERSGAAKLTEAQVIQIRSAAGTHREIAERFGVAPTTIANIRNGENWTHVKRGGHENR